MERIDMGAIARFMGEEYGDKYYCHADNDIDEECVALQDPKDCIRGTLEGLPTSCNEWYAENITPNFRDPEWLVRLKNELSERGYIWEFGRMGSVVICLIKDHIRQEEKYAEQAINWIDAFLLAVTKLAKEG